MTDPRSPVIVGVGQLTRRPDAYGDVRDAQEPVDLMTEAVRLADADAGGRLSLVGKLEATLVSQPMSRRYPDPGALVNERLGSSGAKSTRAVVGGNSPQLLVDVASQAISRGELDVAVVVGAEAMYSRNRAKREGETLPWELSELPAAADEVGDTRPGTTPEEEAHGARLPIEIYPLIETALRGVRHRSVDEHQAATGELWSRFSGVAAANPHAWTREGYTAGEVVEPSDENRIITFPYTKRMCANLTVDQAAAVLLTSVEAAREAGVPDERLVFPLAGAEANDHFTLSERWCLAESPAVRVAAREALAAARTDIDAVEHVDLYSCFPSAVQVAADALGLEASDDLPLTLTGGLAFFGGPGNNYVAHSIAATVAACRATPGSIGLVTGVGYYLTKHALGLYSTAPPVDGFRRLRPQTQVDALPSRRPAGPMEGEATVEATAVVHERDAGPVRATVSLLTDEGARALAVSDDPDVLSSMVGEAWEGRRVKLRPVDGVNRLVV